jgi:hypothetical protein
MQAGGNRTFVWLLAFTVLAALLFAMAFLKGGVDSREAMLEMVERLKREASSSELPRSVLTGQPSAGNAWDEYNTALDDTVSWRNDENGGVFLRFAKGDTHLQPAQVEQLVAEHTGALGHLRLGAHQSDGKYPYDWDKGSAMALPNLLGCRRLAYLAVAQAKIHSESGRLQNAIDLLLDTSVFGRDIAADAPMLTRTIGLVVYSTTFEEFQNLILSGKLTKYQLVELARKLEIVDHDFPAWSSALSAETLGLSVAMLHAPENGRLGWFDLTKQWGGRFTVSPDAAILKALEEKEAYLHRAEKLDQMNFAEVGKEIDTISAETPGSSDAPVRLPAPDLLRSIVTYRKALAELRLLRAATTFLGTGEMIPLPDPFGDNLLYEDEGNKLKIWSAGSGDGQIGILLTK